MTTVAGTLRTQSLRFVLVRPVTAEVSGRGCALYASTCTQAIEVSRLDSALQAIRSVALELARCAWRVARERRLPAWSPETSWVRPRHTPGYPPRPNRTAWNS